MSKTYHILDTALPKGQNFTEMKTEALAFLQKYSDNEWTNFNPSDPGITILDQLCYALTELGYCIDFPIKDLLTKHDGELRVKDQFFTTEEILTTSPITINDYRKSLIDSVEGINNVEIKPLKYKLSGIVGVYETRLLIDTKYSDPDEVSDLRYAAFLHLNSIRNNGELFLIPKVYERKELGLKGEIEIKSKKELANTIYQISESIKDYIFPKITQNGYLELKDEGVDTNSIFEGPILKNGWILDKELVDKKHKLPLSEVVELIKQNDNVISVNGIKYTQQEAIVTGQNKSSQQRRCFDELIVVQLEKSIMDQDLKLLFNGVVIDHDLCVSAIKSRHQKRSRLEPHAKAVLNSKPKIPRGKFREIDKYYSIQRTFPDVYRVGKNAVEDNASNDKIAESRQLRGYLTMFDQVLANEYAQLDNVWQLLSFKNSISSDPKDKRWFYDTKDDREKENLEYPVPYLKFSPSYYCQSLYYVPNIRPILKDNRVFNFGLEQKSTRQEEKDTWKAYKEDPYNAYIHGLIESLEEPEDGLKRRNQILDHLLARHGQSPYLINKLIDGSVCTGNYHEDRVIFKSLYLQNLALLSYYEQKTYNALGATEIKEGLPAVTAHVLRDLRNELSSDFVFRAHKVDYVEQLHNHDFRNFSSLTLKLNLLFGLRFQYRQFIIDEVDKEDEKELTGTQKHLSQQLISQAYWFMKRKGSVTIENNLLVVSAQFDLAFKDDDGNVWVLEINNYFNYIDVVSCLNNMSKEDFNASIKNLELVVNLLPYSLKSGEPNDWEFNKKNTFETSSWSYTFKASWGGEIYAFEGHDIFKNDLHLLLPKFALPDSESVFRHRFDLLCENTLAAHTDCKPHFIKTDLLSTFIPNYIQWFNSFIYKPDQRSQYGKVDKRREYAFQLLNDLVNIGVYSFPNSKQE